MWDYSEITKQMYQQFLDTLKKMQVLNPEEIANGLMYDYIKNYGGVQIYLPSIGKIEKKIRDREIQAEFKGRNYAALAREHKISEKTVRKIISAQQPLF